MSKLGAKSQQPSNLPGDSQTLSDAIVSQGQATGQQFGDRVVQTLEASMEDAMVTALQSFSIDRVVGGAIKKSGIAGSVQALLSISPSPATHLPSAHTRQLGSAE